MPKGHYTIDNSLSSGHGDTSFRACVIALLIFLLFCVTITIILLVLKKDSGSSRGGHGAAKTSAHTGNETHPDSKRPSTKVDYKHGLEDRDETSTTPHPILKPIVHGNDTKIDSKSGSEDEGKATTTPPPDVKPIVSGNDTKIDGRSGSEDEVSTTPPPDVKPIVSGNDTKIVSRSGSEDEVSTTPPPDVKPIVSGNDTKIDSRSGSEDEGADTTTTPPDVKPIVSGNDTKIVSRSGSEDEGKATTTPPPDVKLIVSGNDTKIDDRSGSEDEGAATTTPPPDVKPIVSGNDTKIDSRSGSEDEGAATTTPPPDVKPIVSGNDTKIGGRRESEDKVVCKNSTTCNLAGVMLATMGHGANPCKNFYEFACGGLRRNKYLLEPNYAEESFLRIEDELNNVHDVSPTSYKKFKALKESCDNYDPQRDIQKWKEPVLKELKNLGSTFEDDSSLNFTHLFLELLQRDRPFIIDVTLDINDTAPSKFAIKIMPAAVIGRMMYLQESGAFECQKQAAQKHNDLNDMYTETLKCTNSGEGRRRMLQAAREALQALGIFNSSDEAEKINATIKDYAEFLNSRPLGVSIEQRLELQKRQPNLATIDDLNKLFENLNVNWTTIIEHLINRKVRADEEIQVYSREYFENINRIFESRQRVLRRALLVEFVTAHYYDLLVAQQHVRRVLHPPQCVRTAALLMPDVGAALYLDSFDSLQRRQLLTAVENIHYELIDAFFDEIKNSPFLKSHRDLMADIENKVNHGTLFNMTDAPGFKDTGKLDLELEEISINDTDFVQNAIMLMGRNRRRLYKRINENPSDHIWSHFIAPYDSEAKTIYSLNAIAIPLGALQKPFFDPRYPAHLKIAGLGFTVAHEMMHSIDTIGIRFNTTAKKAEIEKYIQQLPAISKCNFKNDVKVEYMNMTGPDKNKPLTFQFTESECELKRNEYLSDYMAIKLIYKKLKNEEKRLPSLESIPFINLNKDQIFFVHLAQKYCRKDDYSSMIIDFFESSEFPPETRMKHIMEEQLQFRTSFNCHEIVKDFPFPYTEFEEEDGPTGEATFT